MEVILPFNTHDRELFCNSAIEIGFDEFTAAKYIYTMQDSDIDVFQLLGEQRLSLLNYGWEICERYIQVSVTDFQSLPAAIQTVTNSLIHYSLDVWFSKEWGQSRDQMKKTLLYCLRRARRVFANIPSLSLLDWQYLLQLDTRPWQIAYLGKFFNNTHSENIKATHCIERVEEPVAEDDLEHLKKEGIFLSLLRLIKMFDAGFMEAVKLFSMRIIVAWNHMNDSIDPSTIDDQHKRCLVLICHIYLMAIYELDDARGFVIDNMMHNIRFYCKNTAKQRISGSISSPENMGYTSARYIAMICEKLGMHSGDFFVTVIFDTFDESFTTLFGAVSHAYMSYVLGNMLMEMNCMNDEDFTASLDNFKRILNFYIIERERSELFMQQEIFKQQKQQTCHNEPMTIKNMTDFKSKICKGNRKSNISDYVEEGEGESVEQSTSDVKEDERRIDPVFQNLPNNANILNYVYNVLAKKSYKGWHFAKLVLLLRIIGHELNEIETWRYHPGLTTDFMLNLEIKLSRHFEDLALIFQEHPFMEQEFWLTAFYLNPTTKYFSAVCKCGMRAQRQRHNDENVNPDSIRRTEKKDQSHVKFGLLSSTVDVQEIVRMANHDTPNADYEPLNSTLQSFRLPDSIIKDLLTVTFLPRNKSFAWAVNWRDLRKRCKDLLKCAERKKRLVELNMAEANDRLKFLKIDYDKYKHRPQLDYGSIEEGYEAVGNYGDYDANADDDDDDDDYDDETDFSDYPSEATSKEEKFEEELPETFFMGTRRTRARTAAIIASFHTTKREQADKSPEGVKIEQLLTETTENSENPKFTNKAETEDVPSIAKCDLKEWLEKQNKYNNSTNGFKSFPDIWNFDTQELHKVEETTSSFFEINSFMGKFTKLHDKSLEILAEDDEEDQEHNEDIMNSSYEQKGNDEFSDDESDTSVMAFKGSHERLTSLREDDLDKSLQDDEKIPNDIEPAEANPQGDNKTEQPITADQSTTSEDNKKMPSENELLIEQCMKKKLQVSVRRLVAADVSHLRQPTVRLKRINIENWYSKRLKVFSDSDASAKSCEYETIRVGVSKRGRRFRAFNLKRQSSESSNESDEFKLKRKFDQPTHSRAAGYATRGRPRSKNLMVTPRSASGLKLRISSMGNEDSQTEIVAPGYESPELINFIHISSSNTPEVDDIVTTESDNTQPRDAGKSEDSMDPLYEEEIIVPFDY